MVERRFSRLMWTSAIAHPSKGNYQQSASILLGAVPIRIGLGAGVGETIHQRLSFGRCGCVSPHSARMQIRNPHLAQQANERRDILVYDAAPRLDLVGYAPRQVVEHLV